MSIEGTWDCTVDTPMGAQKSVLTFKNADGSLTGSATSSTGETIELKDISESGTEASWTVPVEKPIKLDVKTTVTVSGTSATGKAKLGMFGTAQVNMTKKA